MRREDETRRPRRAPEPAAATAEAAGAPDPGRGTLDAARIVALQRSAGNAAVARLVSQRPPRDGSPVLQRYQAGGSGHGGIEEPALEAAGLSAAEAKTAYSGNWLRDLSQLPKNPAVTYLIRILSMGEFGRDTSADELGAYVPSEHLDNPEGGGTVEDPAVRADPVLLKAALEKLSPAQRAAYEREEAARGEILDASAQSHLPAYIETGKFHAKEKLREAVTSGRTPVGLRAMGNALHDVEDYYSHSNFTEACIYMLRGDPAMKPLVALMGETHLGANQALLTPVDPLTGEVRIQSGTYAAGANDWVSKLELLQSEVEHGELMRAFAIGWLTMAGITGEEIGRRLGAAAGGGVGKAVGAVGGGVGGAVGGAVTGAASGAAEGFREGHGFFGTIGSTLGGLFSGGAHGAVSGAQSGAASGAKAVGDAGASVGGAIGGFAGRSVADVIAIVGLTAVLAVIAVPFAAIFAAAKAGLLDKIAEHEANQSAAEAAAKGLSGPTHSELAKDAPDHKLFGASTALASAADREIGEAMIRAWAATAAAGGAAPSAPSAPDTSGSGGSATAAATATAPAFTPEQEAVAALVDKYVCNPAQQDWWQPIVLAEAAKS
jgi:hypothetical protein